MSTTVIKDRNVKRHLRRLARLSVISKVISDLANKARAATIEAMKHAGVVIQPGEGNLVDVPLRTGSMRIQAVAPGPIPTLDTVELARRFKDKEAYGITDDQLIACVTGWDSTKLEAVFGAGLITTTPSQAEPTLRFTPSKDPAIVSVATRFANRVGGTIDPPAAKPRPTAKAA